MTNVIQSDAVGSITNDGINSFTYDQRGRLIAASGAGGSGNVTAQYRVNALGQRVAKALGGTTPAGTNPDIRYVYDAQGRLIAETLPNGQTVKEYLYLHDLPVAVIVAPAAQ